MAATRGKKEQERATTVGCFVTFGKRVGELAKDARISTPKWLEEHFGEAVREKYEAMLGRKLAALTGN